MCANQPATGPLFTSSFVDLVPGAYRYFDALGHTWDFPGSNKLIPISPSLPKCTEVKARSAISATK